MRFLKNKIARASALSKENVLLRQPVQVPQTPSQELSPIKTPSLEPRKKKEGTKIPQIAMQISSKKNISGDNIMKNYGRAMANFALSSMAQNYLVPILSNLNITLSSFHNYISTRKKSANCIKQLRAMLPLGFDSAEEDVNFKKAFQQICIIFLKFFCVNWLYSSKIAEKIAHLKYRFKILRRVRNPQYFTYLKDFNDHNHHN